MRRTQIQCAKCACTLYFTTNGTYGMTGELCDSCYRQEEEEYRRRQEEDYYDDY